MRRVGNLFERLSDFHSLSAAARRAAKGKPLGIEACEFLLNLETEALRLQRELLNGSYRPREYRTFAITDPKPRTISAAVFRDRVVHHALCDVLEPSLERYAISDSYACRPGKGGYAAVKRAQCFAKRFPYFLKLDVQRFFETADHGVLKVLLRRLIKDKRVLELCDRFIDAGAPGSAQGKGLPIGNLTSQHFANLYLGPLDHYVKVTLQARGYCRYMDDHLFYAHRRDELAAIHDKVAAFVEGKLLLELKRSATRAGLTATGVPFLGFRIWPRAIRLDAYRARRFRVKIRHRTHQLRRDEIDADVWARSLASLCGWAEQADTHHFRFSFFNRMRCDAILPD